MKLNLLHIYYIALYTAKEILRSKILLVSVCLGFGIIFISYIASELTYGTPQKIALDFGVGFFSLSANGIAIFMGANLLLKEIESRTIYLSLSRPVKRFSFLLGKLLGMGAVLGLNILILSLTAYVTYFFLGGAFEILMLWVALFAFFEAFLLLNIVVLFSLVTNISLSVFYTLVIYGVGHSISSTLELSFVQRSFILEFVVRLYSFVFPNLNQLNYRDYLIYDVPISSSALFFSLLYGMIYSVFLLLVSSKVFVHKELS